LFLGVFLPLQIAVKAYVFIPYVPCFGAKCQPVDGQWGSWGSWSACDSNCKKSRSRSCNNPAPVKGGKYCYGSSKEEDTCSGGQCVVKGDLCNGYKHFPSSEAIDCTHSQAHKGSCDGTVEDCIAKGFEMCNNWSGCLGIRTHPTWMAANKSPQLCRPVSQITKLEKRNNWDFYVKCDAIGDPCRKKLTGWTEFEGDCYEYHEDKKTWTDAQAVCDKGVYRYKGVLAAASSATRNNFISTSFTTDKLWIGGFKSKSSGLWQWTDGSAWNYTSWATSPVQQPSGDGTYIDTNQFGSGMWNDRQDDVFLHNLPFVCQYPAFNDTFIIDLLG